jgi:hypothetical protein
MFRLPKPHPEERRLRRVSKDGHKRDSGHTFAFPRRLYARAMHDSSASQRERAQGMPGARCARSLVCEIKKHTSIVTTVTPDSPGIPYAAGFNGFLRGLPGDRAFLPPSPRNAKHCRELIPASGYQDATTSPSAMRAFV